jgi:hypothetical protein
MQLIFGKQVTYSLAAVAGPGVADHMDTTPVPVEKLATKVGAYAPSPTLYLTSREPAR